MPTFSDPVNLPSQWHTSDYEAASVGWVKKMSAGTTAGGDLVGQYPDPQIAPGVIVDADISDTAEISQSKIKGLPATLALQIKQYAADVGAGTDVVVNHVLNTRDVLITVYRQTAPYDTVYCEQERTDVDNVTLRFRDAVEAGAYRVVVQGR